MFGQLAKSIAFLLIKYRVLTIDNRDVYTYAIEVILLNATLFVLFGWISIFVKCSMFFFEYLLFFVPLRAFSGGYHAKRSEICFVMSISWYVGTILIYKWVARFYNIQILIVFFIVAIFVVGIWAPLKNPNHPLVDYQFKRNKKIVHGIIFMDVVLCAVLFNIDYKLAFAEMLLVVMVAFFLVVAIFVEKSQKILL